MTAAKLDQIINVEVASCFDAIVEFVQLSETVADYCMKVFSLILVQRLTRGVSGNEAPIFALHGILGLLRSLSLTLAFRGELATSHNVSLLVNQCLVGSSLSKEAVYATIICAQLCILQVPDVTVCHGAIGQILRRELMSRYYGAVIAGLVEIITAAPDGTLDEFLQTRLIPDLIAIIGVAQYNARRQICACVFLAIEKFGFAAALRGMSTDLVGLIFDFVESEDDMAFVGFVVKQLAAMIDCALAECLDEFLEAVKERATSEVREALEKIMIEYHTLIGEDVVDAVQYLLNFVSHGDEGGDG
jgi:hypothetical protein